MHILKLKEDVLSPKKRKTLGELMLSMSRRCQIGKPSGITVCELEAFGVGVWNCGILLGCGRLG